MGLKHAIADRGDDLYETPECATWALCDNVRFPNTVWEPACGRGAIARVLESRGLHVRATDLRDYGYGQGGVDFLMEREPFNGAIVTNPPFKLANEFVAHALLLCPQVFMLLRLSFLESERRRSILESGRLRCVYVFRNRLPMMHRDGWSGPVATSSTAYAWFEWGEMSDKPPAIQRISW